MRTCRVTQGETRSLTNAGTGRERRAARGVAMTLLLFAGLVGCTDRPPARLTGTFGDTLLVNAPDPTRLSVRAEDADGRGARVRDAYWQAVGEVPFSLSADGTVHCTRAGDGTVDVSRGASHARLTVRCRPVAGLRPLMLARLTVGGPPVEVAFEAIGVDRAPISELAVRATVRDTTIASLHNGRLAPRRAGRTLLDVMLPHCATAYAIEVFAREAINDSSQASAPQRIVPRSAAPPSRRSLPACPVAL
jgi:hypothetical protein